MNRQRNVRRNKRQHHFPLPAPGAASFHSLERILSKLGYCSRSQARVLISTGQVKVNGQIVLIPSARVNLSVDQIMIGQVPIVENRKIYLMINKPRGLVTTRQDEKGRETVYRCFDGHSFPWIFPVGRLDKASEGLILFTNDTGWAASLLDPRNRQPRVYHVQINRVADKSLIKELKRGVHISEDRLTLHSVRILRKGQRNSWLEIGLQEGKNRHIRRMMEQLEVEVIRLIRIGFGPLRLGDLQKGKFRHLHSHELNEIIKKLNPPVSPGT